MDQMTISMCCTWTWIKTSLRNNCGANLCIGGLHLPDATHSESWEKSRWRNIGKRSDEVKRSMMHRIAWAGVCGVSRLLVIAQRWKTHVILLLWRLFAFYMFYYTLINCLVGWLVSLLGLFVYFGDINKINYLPIFYVKTYRRGKKNIYRHVWHNGLWP